MVYEKGWKETTEEQLIRLTNKPKQRKIDLNVLQTKMAEIKTELRSFTKKVYFLNKYEIVVILQKNAPFYLLLLLRYLILYLNICLMRYIL